jgi:excisionase family DNA binding protein
VLPKSPRPARSDTAPPAPRFLTLADVAEILNTSTAQVSALVKRRELKAMKIGGRGQWRVEVSALEAYIAQAHADTERLLEESSQEGPEG